MVSSFRSSTTSDEYAHRCLGLSELPILLYRKIPRVDLYRLVGLASHTLGIGVFSFNLQELFSQVNISK